MSWQFQLFKGSHTARTRQRGFSMIEIAMVIVLLLVLMCIAYPITQGTLNYFRLRGAVSSATWAIQSTRYQALMEGYPFQVTFNAANNTYQIASEPLGATTFTNVGAAVPLSGDAIALNQTTTVQLNPNGYVSATQGSLTFTISYQGNTETLTVTNYGNVSVSP
ncbi:MAG TPA: GspH/FimT family pseudopilin [Methylomirabilota bacterium]|nr:GspH/FimT family pseudopilin [Methylomirabilota bacterium]